VTTITQIEIPKSRRRCIWIAFTGLNELELVAAVLQCPVLTQRLIDHRFVGPLDLGIGGVVLHAFVGLSDPRGAAFIELGELLHRVVGTAGELAVGVAHRLEGLELDLAVPWYLSFGRLLVCLLLRTLAAAGELHSVAPQPLAVGLRCRLGARRHD
jgi:hypothetical protein